jgi:hypothetical protein
MPHRAGHFVLAYAWDHHCDRLICSLRSRFESVETGLKELAREKAVSRVGLLNYYEDWHRIKALYDVTLNEISSREYVINSLGYRGYGVNKDLLGALVALRNEYAGRLGRSLSDRFRRKVPLVQRLIYLPEESAASLSSGYVISELQKKLGRDPSAPVATAATTAKFSLEPYWRVMSQETSWPTNTAIFQKLFLGVGASSMTIMKGSTGLANGRPAGQIKLLGNRNLVNVCRELFANLDTYTVINLDLFKWIHKSLMQDIDPLAGDFRSIDFPDRNGVTFEYENFQREIGDLAIVLDETAQSFPDFDKFFYNLARSYYMFIGVHPFWDSNGRVGRSFLNYMFVKKGLPPISFKDDEEVLCLPRYGGTMGDMHEYLKRRLSKAIDAYVRERRALQSLDLLDKPVRNASFDSGFFFRQIEHDHSSLQVEFDAYVTGDPLKALSLRNECRVVLPDDEALNAMAIYCGFGRSPGAWEDSFKLASSLAIEETDSDIPGVRFFEVGFVVDLMDRERKFDHFSCIVLSEEKGLLFNNGGLNYNYRLEL